MAVTSTARVQLPSGMHPAAPVFGKLQEHIAEAAACIPCNEVVLIVEASRRADPVLVRHFGELLPTGTASVAVPTRHCFIPKAAREPGLEIADFIISAAKSETVRFMRGAGEFAPDFSDVFRQIPLADRWFSIVTDVVSGEEGVAITVQRLPPPRLPAPVSSSNRWAGAAGITWLLCWFGGWIVEGLLFPNGNGAIGATLGFFGGAILGLYLEHYLQRLS